MHCASVNNNSSNDGDSHCYSQGLDRWRQMEPLIQNAWDQRVSEFSSFHVLEHLPIYDEVSWSPKTKHGTRLFHYTHTLKVILYNIFNNFIHQSVHFLNHPTLTLVETKVLNFGASRILDSQIRDVQPVRCLLCVSFCPKLS